MFPTVRILPAISCALRPALLASLAVLAACSEIPVGVDREPTSMMPPGEVTMAPPARNPLSGARLYVEPHSNARKQADAWRGGRPADAAQMDKLASQPQAVWFGDWNPDPYDRVGHVTATITAAGALPVYVLYNIPLRDCGLWSAGGAASAAAYERWISEVARAIGTRRAVVVLEPDAVAALDCLRPADQRARLAMIGEALKILRARPGISIYIDAGNATWHSPSVIAPRLREAGIELADGFALNVSNFGTTSDNIRYGAELSALVGGKHFVIDTSRNGQGPSTPYEWCNPSGRGLGTAPTTSTGHPLVDAFLWIKSPGESDGECNGGPRAGVWWPEYALGLARRSAL